MAFRGRACADGDRPPFYRSLSPEQENIRETAGHPTVSSRRTFDSGRPFCPILASDSDFSLQLSCFPADSSCGQGGAATAVLVMPGHCSGPRTDQKEFPFVHRDREVTTLRQRHWNCVTDRNVVRDSTCVRRGNGCAARGFQRRSVGARMVPSAHVSGGGHGVYGPTAEPGVSGIDATVVGVAAGSMSSRKVRRAGLARRVRVTDQRNSGWFVRFRIGPSAAGFRRRKPAPSVAQRNDPSPSVAESGTGPSVIRPVERLGRLAAVRRFSGEMKRLNQNS